MVLLNPDLVREYSKEAQDRQPRGEYVAKFAAQGKQLRYIAASHTQTQRDANGNIIAHSQNPTLALIDQQIAEYKPDFILFELPDRFSLQNAPHDRSRIGDLEYEKTLINESQYGSYLALKHGISFGGGEPDESQIVSGMLQKGYQRHDIAYFYAFRSIPNITKNGKAHTSDEVLRQQIDKNLNHYRKELGIAPDVKLDYEGLKQWFSHHNNQPNLTLIGAQTMDAAPLRQARSSYFQRMSADIGDIREENVNRMIQNAINKHERVMVVYGSGHLVKSLPVYEAAFGKPQYETLKEQQPSTAIQPKPSSPALKFGLALVSVTSIVIGFATGFGIPLALAAVASGGACAFLHHQDTEIEKQATQKRYSPASPSAQKTADFSPKTPAKTMQPEKPSPIPYRTDFTKRYLAEKRSQKSMQIS